jgi:hypothetical protein
VRLPPARAASCRHMRDTHAEVRHAPVAPTRGGVRWAHGGPGGRLGGHSAPRRGPRSGPPRHPSGRPRAPPPAAPIPGQTCGRWRGRGALGRLARACADDTRPSRLGRRARTQAHASGRPRAPRPSCRGATGAAAALGGAHRGVWPHGCGRSVARAHPRPRSGPSGPHGRQGSAPRRPPAAGSPGDGPGPLGPAPSALARRGGRCHPGAAARLPRRRLGGP